MVDEVNRENTEPVNDKLQTKPRIVYQCDRCGFDMIEMNCKVVCPNCGNRFDCSDLNIYFD
jgi:rubrerythrin